MEVNAMTPYQRDQVEVLRRIAERGLKNAQIQTLNLPTQFVRNQLDLWQHMLDELARLSPSAGE